MRERKFREFEQKFRSERDKVREGEDGPYILNQTWDECDDLVAALPPGIRKAHFEDNQRNGAVDKIGNFKSYLQAAGNTLAHVQASSDLEVHEKEFFRWLKFYETGKYNHSNDISVVDACIFYFNRTIPNSFWARLEKLHQEFKLVKFTDWYLKLDVGPEYGESALHRVIWNKENLYTLQIKKEVKKLLSENVKTSWRDKWGLTALEYAEKEVGKNYGFVKRQWGEIMNIIQAASIAEMGLDMGNLSLAGS